ncbi:MAG: septal ring lytic transglycosylase RlpA family protein [Saprospiraceae bacterium]|nr:septal ring lytic transglycosylase RlpA family protein [Saprospiraceae bacterium]
MRNRFKLFALLFFAALGSAAIAQDSESGLASYYGDEFQGRRTAYGDKYDKSKLTAAHKRHPYGTMIRVTRLDNKKSVVVKVTDKGPYIKGRVIDLSKKAAERLGMLGDGTAEVEIVVVKRVTKEDDPPAELAIDQETPAEKEPAKEAKSDQPAEYNYEPENDPAKKEATASQTAKAKKSTTVKEEKPTAKIEKTAAAKEVSTTEKAKKTNLAEKSKASPSRGKLVGKDYTQFGLYKIVLERPSQKGYGVQVASLSNYENVLRQVADLQAKFFDNILISVEKGAPNNLYKIILGPFETESAAKNYTANIKKKQKVSGFVVNLSEIKY